MRQVLPSSSNSARRMIPASSITVFIDLNMLHCRCRQSFITTESKESCAGSAPGVLLPLLHPGGGEGRGEEGTTLRPERSRTNCRETPRTKRSEAGGYDYNLR